MAYDETDFIEAVEYHSPASTNEVAEYVGCSRPTANTQLKILEATGSVDMKKIANVLVWTINESDTDD